MTTTTYADLNGTRYFYEASGEGPALLLIHGMNLHQGQWDEQAAAFAEHFHVIRPDLRGFGRTEMPKGDFSYHADLRELLRQLGVEKAHVLGFSMGGRVAMEMAIHDPDLVDKLVLAAPGLLGYEYAEHFTRFGGGLEDALKRGDLDEAVEINLQWAVDCPFRTPDQVDPAVRARAAALFHDSLPLPRPGNQLPTENMPGRLQEISCPTQLLVGDLDYPDFHRIAALLAERLPRLQTHILQGAGHTLNIEQPQAFNRHVLDFLK